MNKHLILVKYLGPTNFRPSRIALISGRRKGDRLIIPYDYLNSSNITEIASRWLTDHGYTIVCTCETPGEYGILVNEFVMLVDAEEIV